MGDRANLQIVLDGNFEEKSIWIYTHNDGTELPELARVALIAAKPRWDDAPYGARIIATNLFGHIQGDTGWGLDLIPGDKGDGGRVVNIDFQMQQVTLITMEHGVQNPMSFQEYISEYRRWPGESLEEDD